MVALIILSGVIVAQTAVMVWGYRKLAAEKAHLQADAQQERARVSAWLDTLPQKAEVAVRREANLLIQDIKKKI